LETTAADGKRYKTKNQPSPAPRRRNPKSVPGLSTVLKKGMASISENPLAIYISACKNITLNRPNEYDKLSAWITGRLTMT
jgi:hypothetical protein